MFDLGGTELLLIGIVALVVVGPKELPTMFRAIGMLTGRAREMAREFTSAMNSAADQSGLQEINKTIKAATNPANFGMNKLKEASGLKPAATPAKPATAAAPIPAAGTPIPTPAAAAPVMKPGGETEQLAAKVAATKAKNAEAAAARKAAKAASDKAEALPEVPDTPLAQDRKPAKKPAKPRTKKPLPAPDPTPPVADDTP